MITTMKWKKMITAIIAVITLLIAVNPVWAHTQTKGTYSARIYDKEWLDVNRWRCPFYNDGRFGIDVGTRRDAAGGYWPYPLRNFYIFGAGLWVGALRPRADDPERLDTLVTVGYNPNSGATENVPTLTSFQTQGYGNAFDRIYKYPGSWDIAHPDFKKRFIPNDDSSYIKLGLVPTENFSAGDMWMCFCDADPTMHVEPGKPLGVDIYLTVYAWNYPSNRDIFFLLYKVKNVSGDTLKDMVLGVVMDADIGDPADDMVGLIKNKLFLPGTRDSFRVKDVGYNYDYNGQETPRAEWQGGTPGAVAYKFLESPRAGPGDTTHLGMTAFKMFTIEIDPVKDPDQYLTMAGYDYRTRIKSPYDSIDLVGPKDKRFIQCSGPFILPPDSVTYITVAVIAAEYPGSGNPPTIWDTLPLARVAAEAQFIYDQGWLLPEPPPSPNIRLIPGDKKVTITWDNYSELVPDKFYPVAQFSDTSSPSYNPDYKEYDFQGYKLYRSDDDGVNWTLLTQCDLIDGIRFEDTLVSESVRTIACDTGLIYTYVDENVANGFTYYYAVNAYDYNYLRFRTGSVVTREPFWLESGLKYTSVIPRSEPVNMPLPSQLEVKFAGDTNVKVGVNISAEIVEPSAITGKKYQIRFLEPIPTYTSYLDSVQRFDTIERGPPLVLDTFWEDTFKYAVLPNYRYYVASESAGKIDTLDTLISSSYIYNILTARKRNFGAPVFDGLKMIHEVYFVQPEGGFLDSVIVIAGNYPKENLNDLSQRVRPFPLWPFRGTDFMIVWEGRSPDSLTVKVTDMVTNTSIPYNEYRYWANETDSVINMKRAGCWNFSGSPPRRTRPSPILRGTDSYLYICGQPINLNGTITDSIRSLRSLINPGDTWIAYCKRETWIPNPFPQKGYKLEGYLYKRAPSGCAFNLSTAGTKLVFDTSAKKLNIIVTPNPYLVTNRWERNRYERQIAFTRLPNECTIRIFTLAGDLVRVIEHKESSERRTDPANPITNDLGGTEIWNLLNRSEALVASGVYIFYVESKIGKQVGKFAIIH